MLIAHKAAACLATAALGQAITAQLVAAIGPDSLTSHRAALAGRRDRLVDHIDAYLPSRIGRHESTSARTLGTEALGRRAGARLR